MEINVLVDAEFELRLNVGELESIVERVLVAAEASSNVEVGLVITSQEKVHQLNKNYRGVDEPTDVLAFSLLPAPGEGESSAAFVPAPDSMLHLGEIIISYPQAVIQAEEHHHSVVRELTILIIHGVLHLLGHDHVAPEAARQMAAREADILNRLEEKS